MRSVIHFVHEKVCQVDDWVQSSGESVMTGFGNLSGLIPDEDILCPSAKISFAEGRGTYIPYRPTRDCPTFEV
jgi:hypothetical protein